MLEGGKRVSYGARALNECGLQSLPKLVFPGGALIGCAAGFLNVPKIKGSHNAMKTGMLAAEAAFEALTGENEAPAVLEALPRKVESSWVYEEHHKARNFRPPFSRRGLFGAIVQGGMDMESLGGRAARTQRPRNPTP